MVIVVHYRFQSSQSVSRSVGFTRNGGKWQCFFSLQVADEYLFNCSFDEK